WFDNYFNVLSYIYFPWTPGTTLSTPRAFACYNPLIIRVITLHLRQIVIYRGVSAFWDRPFFTLTAALPDANTASFYFFVTPSDFPSFLRAYPYPFLFIQISSFALRQTTWNIPVFFFEFASRRPWALQPISSNFQNKHIAVSSNSS
ncbi:hypothetical protein ACKVWC_010902, partial [Pyricularia oryzae]